MRAKRLLIVEDNIDTARLLVTLVKEVDDKAICHTTSNLNEVYEIIHNNVIDVFLLDIILNKGTPGDVSGLELAEKIRGIEIYKFTPIIFISSLTDPKMYTYSTLHSYKYIEKPFSLEETKNTIKEALNYKNGRECEKYHYFRRDGILFIVKEEEIVYIESKLRRMFLCTTKETIDLPYRTCSDILEGLRGDNFVKCNRGTIVNKNYIANIDFTRRYIKLRDGYGVLSIGKKYLKELVDKKEL